MLDSCKMVQNSLKHSVRFCGIFSKFKTEVSPRPDCLFEIHRLRQSGFSWVYSNCCCSCSFDSETIKVGQLSHKMDSNNKVNFRESMIILNACTKKSGKLLKASRRLMGR